MNKNKIRCKILDDEVDLMCYSADSSDIEKTPKLVVIPRTTEDVACAVKFAGENNLNIIEIRFPFNNHNDEDQIKKGILYMISSLCLNCEVKFFLGGHSYNYLFDYRNQDIVLSSKINRTLNYINNNYYDKITLERAAKEVNLNKFHLSKKFSSETGISFKRYLCYHRLYRASKVLRSYKNITVTKVCFEVGFGDLSNFIRQFKNFFGCSPKKFMNCNINPQICDYKKGSFFRVDNGNELDKFSHYFKFPLRFLCYLKRQE